MTVTTVLLIALVISAMLIIFQPGTRTFTLTTPTARAITSTAAPLYPPGTGYYYRGGQWQPYDQQEAPQP
jgi:hypothetical protein